MSSQVVINDEMVLAGEVKWGWNKRTGKVWFVETTAASIVEQAKEKSGAMFIGGNVPQQLTPPVVQQAVVSPPPAPLQNNVNPAPQHKTYDGKGAGRKQCPACGVFIGIKCRQCNCGHTFTKGGTPPAPQGNGNAPPTMTNNAPPPPAGNGINNASPPPAPPTMTNNAPPPAPLQNNVNPAPKKRSYNKRGEMEKMVLSDTTLRSCGYCSKKNNTWSYDGYFVFATAGGYMMNSKGQYRVGRIDDEAEYELPDHHVQLSVWWGDANRVDLRSK